MRRVSPEEHEIAVRVLLQSKFVENWALSELRAYGIDPKSPEGKKFFKEKCKEYAETILSG